MALGYTSGAQMLGNELSALPGDGLFAASRVDPLRIASLICSNPTGAYSYRYGAVTPAVHVGAWHTMPAP